MLKLHCHCEKYPGVYIFAYIFNYFFWVNVESGFAVSEVIDVFRLFCISQIALLKICTNFTLPSAE